MADFDAFERLFREALTQGDQFLGEAAAAMASLDESSKIHVIKGRDPRELEEFLVRARNYLRDQFGDDAMFATSNNNKAGKDLTHVQSGREIELKSGLGKTDANNGIALVAWATGVDPQALSLVMSGRLKERREAYLRADNATLEASKSQTMDDLYRLWSAVLSEGAPAPVQLCHYARCIARGVTTQDAIKRSFGSTPTLGPCLLRIDWEKGLTPYEQAFHPEEEILIEKVGRTEGRAQIVLRGSQSQRKVRIYPNFKNSYKRKSDGKVVPADAWVRTPCFQVWVA